MSQADFRFFNTKHSTAPPLHPPPVTLQITNLELFYSCSRQHIHLQHRPKTALNLKGPKTAVATVSPARGKAQGVPLGHSCVPDSLGLQRPQEMQADIHKLAAVGRAPAMNVH